MEVRGTSERDNRVKWRSETAEEKERVVKEPVWYRWKFWFIFYRRHNRLQFCHFIRWGKNGLHNHMSKNEIIGILTPLLENTSSRAFFASTVFTGPVQSIIVWSLTPHQKHERSPASGMSLMKEPS